MSSWGIMEGVVAAPEQLCYIPCNFCNIVLAVSVPCSSMFDTVTVRCGHCANLWSVNMAAAFHQSLSSSSPSSSWLGQHRQDHHLHHIQQQAAAPNNNYTAPEYRIDVGSSSSSKCSSNNKKMPLRPSANTKAAAAADRVHRPPEKRQRVPSAYNQFIKEEIQRIKANNPDISHREAFSTAAKNWAHFPHIHFGLMLETNNQPNKLDDASGNRLCSMSRASLRNK